MKYLCICEYLIIHQSQTRDLLLFGANLQFSISSLAAKLGGKSMDQHGR